MGCGQSKINLYPRRSKHNKRSSKRSVGAVENEESDEEEGSPEPAAEEPEPEEPDPQQYVQQHVLPIADHQPAFEVSISQQDFFKMLDEKIAQGKDYDPMSEEALREEEERRRRLIEHWRAHCPSTYTRAQASPALPARRLTRSVSRVSERQCAPGTSRCHQDAPTRRSHAVQTCDPRLCADWDPSQAPLQRTQSAGSNRRGYPKVASMPKTERKDEPVAAGSKDSQITYNPTFQCHSPARSQASSSPTKYIAPPQEYQDPEGAVSRPSSHVSASHEPQIYYIHGNSAAAGPPPDIVQQRQQTVMHLQQYVAMKQAQQHLFTSYLQGTYACPDDARRMFEGEELAAQYGHPGFRPQSAPGRGVAEVAHGHAAWSPLPPVMTTPWAEGQIPAEMQYYPQSQFVPMFRAGSAGSAGTLTRYHKKEERTVQSLSVVKGKPVGQIVSVGGQELAVSSAVSDSTSPASVSTDSGVSPGTSAPSSKSSFSTTPPTTSANETFDPKPKKNKSGPTRALKVSKSLDA